MTVGGVVKRLAVVPDGVVTVPCIVHSLASPVTPVKVIVTGTAYGTHDAAWLRKQARRREAHVRPFREESGNAGMTARELPSDEVLAGWQNVEQRARDLGAAGYPGTLRELRIRAYLDLLQERDSRLTAGTVPDQGQGQGQGQGPADGPDGPARLELKPAG